MSKNFQIFLERLKSLQGDQSVSSFARFLGIPQKSLDNYTKGLRKPSVELVLLVCSKTGVSADYLLGLSDDPSPARQGSNTATNSPGAVVGHGAHGGNCATCPLLQAAARKIASLA